MENIAPLCGFSQRTLKETEDQDKTSFEHATFEGLIEEAQQKWEIPDDPTMTLLSNDFDVFFSKIVFFNKKRFQMGHIQNVHKSTDSCRGNQPAGKHHVKESNLEVIV